MFKTPASSPPKCPSTPLMATTPIASDLVADDDSNNDVTMDQLTVASSTTVEAAVDDLVPSTATSDAECDATKSPVLASKLPTEQERIALHLALQRLHKLADDAEDEGDNEPAELDSDAL